MNNKTFREAFILQFGCINDEISSNSLANALFSLNTIIDEINTELHTGKKIEIKVKPFQAGSFTVPFELVEMLIAGMLSVPDSSYIPLIIKTLKELVEVRVKLKGEQPKSIEKTNNNTQVTSNNGDVINISNVTGNIYVNNTIVNDAFSQTAQALKSDEAIQNYELKDSKNNSLFKIQKNELKYLEGPSIQPDETAEIQKEKVITQDTKLNIFKIVFDETSKWTFIYKGQKINAKIQDDNFHNDIKMGERFGIGDILEVKLQILQEYNETAKTYVNKAYEITNVIKHIPQPKQSKLF